MTKTYHSRFKKHIIGLIEQKRALGHDYSAAEYSLKRFDTFCIDFFPSESILTKSIVLKWAEAIGDEKPQSRDGRVTPVRDLARYMNGTGIDAYVVPTRLFPKKIRYIPHIFTPVELTAIFSVLDRIQPSGSRYPIRHLVAPVIFRMIYCCGLRPKEGREILRRNVDLKTGKIVIQEAKNHKDRTIVLSTDMLKLSQQYDNKVEAVFPDRRYFFPNSDGNPYSYFWTQGIFRRCLDDTKLSFIGNRPRVYDLRHTFATNAIFRWMKEGKDVNARLPYLSTYLGHEHFSYTAYYIHLVPQYFSQISEMYLSKHSHLIPEIEDED
jgi:integrase